MLLVSVVYVVLYYIRKIWCIMHMNKYIFESIYDNIQC